MLVDGVIWLAPLPGVEILAGQELYMSYDWEFWYRRWSLCDPHLRSRIALRYPVACSSPRLSNPPTAANLEDLRRTSEFWYKHWSWWSPTTRLEIRRLFPIDKDQHTLYPLDGHTLEFEEAVDSDDDDIPVIPEEFSHDSQVDYDPAGDARRRAPTVLFENSNIPR